MHIIWIATSTEMSVCHCVRDDVIINFVVIARVVLNAKIIPCCLEIILIVTSTAISVCPCVTVYVMT